MKRITATICTRLRNRNDDQPRGRVRGPSGREARGNHLDDAFALLRPGCLREIRGLDDSPQSAEIAPFCDADHSGRRRIPLTLLSPSTRQEAWMRTLMITARIPM